MFTDQALLFMLWSYRQIVSLVMDHFGMPDRAEFGTRFEDAVDAFQREPSGDGEGD